MRVPLAAVVVLCVTLPPVGEANPITLESMPPGAVGDRRTDGASADAGNGSGHSPLFDANGDSILLLYSSNAFEPPGNHGKLRGGPSGSSGVFFVPTGGPSFGSWSGVSSGSWGGGGSNGGSSSGFGSFTLLSLGPQGTPPSNDPPSNPSFGFAPGPEGGFEGTNTFSFEPCCQDETPTVPEPATLLMVGGGLLMGLKRGMRARTVSTTR